MLKLTIKTDRKINAIKIIRTITGSDLVAAKDSVECGMLFDSYETLHDFLTRFERGWRNDCFGFAAPTIEVSIFDRPRSVPRHITSLAADF